MPNSCFYVIIKTVGIFCFADDPKRIQKNPGRFEKY